MIKPCPKCGSGNIERIEDGYKCRDCGFSETPIGWDQEQEPGIIDIDMNEGDFPPDVLEEMFEREEMEEDHHIDEMEDS